MIRMQYLPIVYLALQCLVFADERDLEDQIMRHSSNASWFARQISQVKGTINHKILLKVEQKESPNYFKKLPIELKEKIVKYLDPVSCIALKRSYLEFEAIVTDTILLRNIPTEVKRSFLHDTPPLHIILGEIIYSRWLKKGRKKDLYNAASLGHAEANERTHEYRKQSMAKQCQYGYQTQSAMASAFCGGVVSVGF